MSLRGSCHCGSVRLILAHAPSEVVACDCSLCSRRGMLWAEYANGDVTPDGHTEPYNWGDRNICFRHCPKCGCTTHWESRRKGGHTGVNARLIDSYKEAGGENVTYSFGGEPVRISVLEGADG